ncbi:DUF4355 domain-containing protein [Lactobacillus taiwanensis]|uniref:DUF4355 domain-containing protein n=1 Tax=Lactobacillus taiwanensis TaxID=508451 RepID=UPI000B98D318|nr:DUF4355 domain-containing protein [Lactobacillus taiwanensis]OYR95110.1 hypothetical protein CBF51_09075 [Lactobacillus taiwanensis]OYS02495.1 hypothetical protein CBF61_02350 [Lactobacillus taiwanensis]OYS16214.1 hypothetical protein CBF69_02530 [Lactobacillus taiwanensis]OYS16297.1 hypothetical protein CBF69_03025 [Lactobacillus taiwanensis]OYS32347.1 hypothetical protein CBF85_10540 [Lactobacillus taiwanensis]
MGEQANNTVTQSADVEPEKQDSAQSEKTFSQAEVDEMVKSRLAREKDKMRSSLRAEIEEDVRNKIKNEQSEANKLKKMNEDQRRKYDMDKKDQEIAELKAKLNRSDMEHVATDLLSKKGISADSKILNFVVAEDAETTQANIDRFVDLINKKAQANRREDFDVPEPKNGFHGEKAADVKEFNKMGYHERLELKQKQPTLYQQLLNKSYEEEK